jgi:polyhydroxyalkanoate synthesis repressor PhaR
MAREAKQPGEPRVIKKYPNRRLYDTDISSYITLEDVRRLVIEQTAFCVRDAKSSEDITRSILLQIILEQEEDGEPIFSEQVLSQIIRFYGDSLQGMVTTNLERMMKLFVDQQEVMREQMQNVMTGDPLALMRDITEQNLSLWKEMQEGFFRTSGRQPGSKKGERD